MQELVPLLEYISIDVVLIGLVFSLFLALSWSVWANRHLGACHGAKAGLRLISAFARTAPKTSWTYPVMLLVVSSQVGTVLVRLSDEILDSDVITNPLFLYVPKIGDLDKPTHWLTGEWKEEDLLKVEVLNDALTRADFSPQIKTLLKRHLPYPHGHCSKTKDEDDCAKGFFQHANAVVRSDRGSDAQREDLRRQQYIVYLLSVIFVGTWLLLLTMLVGPFWVVGCRLCRRCSLAWKTRSVAPACKPSVVFFKGLIYIHDHAAQETQ